MTLEDLEKTISHLPPEELAKFREWFLDFDAAQFDKRIEIDAKDGRLDSLADAALRDHSAGNSTQL
ncbi:hypothetical protein [Rhodopirellula europaea]|uniref:Uncharacterized protein n=1 Tax=Rhodopirellula europaea 6C TaxID=1263867 RepID=M2AXS1_9BACT|nr:hypothetical protein [Rhodopirellula europaea]EMB14338.1 hypothetical protein RE6C_04760 [Rhodopirellula europaea 6C]